MAKVMVEIEIPDGHEIVGVPEAGYSSQIIGGTQSHRVRVTTRPIRLLDICGQPAEWPEWLTCDWIAKDKDGQVCGYFAEPENLFCFGKWCSDGIGMVLSELLDIDIPGPWEQSKRENPRRKK